MHEWFLFNMYVDASRCTVYLLMYMQKKVIVCTKNETRVSAMHGHVCLYNILFFSYKIRNTHFII